MTAILAMNLGDRVVMMSDTAGISQSDHTVQEFHSKMVLIPEANALLAVTGPGILEAFLAHLRRAGRPFTSDTDLYARLSDELRAFHEAERHRWGEGADNFEVVIASCGGDGPRVASMDGPYGLAQAHLVQPWIIDDHKSFEPWRAESWLRFSGFAFPMPPAFVAAARAGCGMSPNNREFDTDAAGVAYFEAARRTKFMPGGYYAVGGAIEEIVLDRAGLKSFRTVKTWPQDRVGEPLGPFEIAAYSRNLADLDNKTEALDNLSLLGTAIASNTTVNLDTATGRFVHITGTTTITGFGTAAAGVERHVVFDGALTLTHNGTSLILPTGANITTAAGDAAIMHSEGSGNWRCISYQRANGRALAAEVYQPLDSDLTAIAALTTTTFGRSLLTMADAAAVRAALDVPEVDTGTFTPGVAFGGGNSGISYNSRGGRYTTFDDTTVAEGFIVLSNKGSSTGTATMTGWPTAAESNQPMAMIAFSNFSGLGGALLGYIGGTSITMRSSGAAGSSNITDTVFTNSSFWAANGAYH